MTDELLPQDADEDLAERLTREGQREALPDHWLEELDRYALDDELLAPMRRDGEPATWMHRKEQDVEPLWRTLRAVADDVRAAAVRVQESDDAEALLDLVPAASTDLLGINLGDWRYVGLTRDGEWLELWFTVEMPVVHPRGLLPGACEIATLRIPLESRKLRKHVFDRVRWRTERSR